MILTRTNRFGLTYQLSDVEETRTRVSCSNGNTLYMNVPLEALNQGFYDWQVRNRFVQDAFPFLTTDEREFLMTGISSEEWDQMFKEGDTQ